MEVNGFYWRFARALQSTALLQLGAQCDTQGCSKIAAPDGDAPNHLQRAVVDALMSAQLFGFLHVLSPSLPQWGCRGAGSLQAVWLRAKVGRQMGGVRRMEQTYPWLVALRCVHSLTLLPKQLRLARWILVVGIAGFSRGAWRKHCHQIHQAKQHRECLLGVVGWRGWRDPAFLSDLGESR